MSGSEPDWAGQSWSGGWWSSPSAGRTERSRGGHESRHGGYFRTRLAVVQAVYNDGSLARAEAIAQWVMSVGIGGAAYVERLALGNWGVVVLRPERSAALWVLTDQHLVLDPRRRAQLDVFSDDEFRTCFECTGAGDRVRECPIFDDGEVAS